MFVVKVSLDLTVNFHHEHCIVLTICPWVSEDVIMRVTEFNYLGVIFDEHLNLNEHVKAIVSEAGRRVCLLGRVRRYITTHSANAIFLIYD